MNKVLSAIIVNILLMTSLFSMHREEPALHKAVREKNWPKIQELLAKDDLNIEEEDSDGNTALHIAIQSSGSISDEATIGPETIIRALLAKEASTKARNRDHKTPIDYATNLTIMNLLLLNSPTLSRSYSGEQHEQGETTIRENTTLPEHRPRRTSFIKRLTSGELLRKSQEK